MLFFWMCVYFQLHPCHPPPHTFFGATEYVFFLYHIIFVHSVPSAQNAFPCIPCVQALSHPLCVSINVTSSNGTFGLLQRSFYVVLSLNPLFMSFRAHAITEIVLFIHLFAHVLPSHPLEYGLHESWHSGHGVFLVLDSWHRTPCYLKGKRQLPALLLRPPLLLLSALPQCSPDLHPQV